MVAGVFVAVGLIRSEFRALSMFRQGSVCRQRVVPDHCERVDEQHKVIPGSI